MQVSLLNYHVNHYKSNNKQLHDLYISYKNCFRIYINDSRVPKKHTHLVSTYNNTNTIKLKLVGFLNSQVYYLKINTKTINTALPSHLKSNVNSPLGMAKHIVNTPKTLSFANNKRQSNSNKLRRHPLTKGQLVSKHYTITYLDEYKNIPNT